MPAYKYEALDAAGKSANGIVEAESMKAARAHLRGQKLVPLGLTLVAVAESSARSRRFSRTAI
jgi:general secretion pathway protein F